MNHQAGEGVADRASLRRRGERCSMRCCSVLHASPFHELLPEELVFAILLHVVGGEDCFEVVRDSAVLLSVEGHFLTALHLRDELGKSLLILLREVSLLITLTLIVDTVGCEGAELRGGAHGHSWLHESE